MVNLLDFDKISAFIARTSQKHLTPQSMIQDLIRKAKDSPPEMVKSIRGLLAQEQWWSDPSTLSEKGALELLTRFKFCV